MPTDAFKTDNRTSIVVNRYPYLFHVDNDHEALAYEFRDQIENHFDDGQNIDHLIAGLLTSYDHVIGRIADEVDGDQIDEINAEIEEKRAKPDPEEILSDLDSELQGADMSVEEARKLKEAIGNVADDDDDGDAMSQFLDKHLDGYNGGD